ncbi:hypothetical protein [Tortoise microvirus 104]|nr:hypothetical protein [Tortoise microvirus 6]QCS37453.1 hypothetical protein [Tortoise microvirus 104]
MDIQLLYPIANDFISNNERSTPELFNYCCFNGKQVFLRRFRKGYQVLTGQWKSNYYKHQNYDMFRNIYPVHYCEDFFTAKMVFKRIVQELLHIEYDLFDTATLEKKD